MTAEERALAAESECGHGELPTCHRCMAAAIVAAEDAALERAAEACDELSQSQRGNDYGNVGNAFDECAARIRALRSAPQQEKQLTEKEGK